MQPRKSARSATLALGLIGSILPAIAVIVMLFVWFIERDNRIRIAEERSGTGALAWGKDGSRQSRRAQRAGASGATGAKATTESTGKVTARPDPHPDRRLTRSLETALAERAKGRD
jgi:hypothetical protein